MNPGTYTMTNTEYHATDGLSASGLKLLSRSPLHYKTNARTETLAMRKGTAAHAAVFEYARFERDYTTAPDIDRRTKAGKEAYAELEASGKIVLSIDDYIDITGMSAAVQSHPLAGRLVMDGVTEQSIFWDNSQLYGDIRCKCRPDYIKKLKDDYIVVDLKTTTDARPEAFAKSAYTLGYHIQAAHYITGVKTAFEAPIKNFVFIAVESSSPYTVTVYQCGNDFLARGYLDCVRLYALYADCLTSGTWPGYTEHLEILELPKWAI
jgi:exodeoxyribonuclease VIII